MIFSSNLLYCLHFINFCDTFSINLQSDIIYSPTLGTSADVPDVPCPTPLSVSTLTLSSILRLRTPDG